MCIRDRSYPVKIIFQDSQGHSYYLEVALSRTNSGMDAVSYTHLDVYKRQPNIFKKELALLLAGITSIRMGGSVGIAIPSVFLPLIYVFIASLYRCV